MKGTNMRVRTYEGNLVATGLKFGIVVGRFNDLFSTKLLDGALDTLVRHGVDADDIESAWVPGAYEVPLVAKRMADSGRYDAVLALGVVIRGGTPHFDLVASEVSKGVARASMESGVPIVSGVITADSIEQAIERSGTKAGNKGAQAAMAAIEMATLMRELP